MKYQEQNKIKTMNYKFFENKACEFYPCHKMDKINCLFCFCPLYNLDCGGGYKLIQGDDGKLIKDCSECTVPHSKCGYDYVIKKLGDKA